MTDELDTPPLWRLQLPTSTAAAPVLADALEELALSVAHFEVVMDGPDWVVEALFDAPPDAAALSAHLAEAAKAAGLPAPGPAHVEKLPETDWLRLNRESFPPLRIGRFEIRGSHVTAPPPAGAIVLTVDAATAFGSGAHATTAGCLLALQSALARRPRHDAHARILDLGCGSGILALGAAALTGRRVLATDIDPEAVRVTRENAMLNGQAHRIAALTGPGFDMPELTRLRFDLILANILAVPLMQLAPRMAAHAAPGADVILSGILARQSLRVASTYADNGFALIERRITGDWATLWLRQRG